MEDEAGKVSTDPTANSSAIVLGEKELEALSDDPDELAAAVAGDGRPRRRSQRRPDLYRWLHRRQSATQVLDSRSAHQFQSVLAGIRPSRLRPHRDLHQARHRCSSRPGFLSVQQGSAQLAQSAADQAKRPPYQNRILWLQPDRADQKTEGVVRLRRASAARSTRMRSFSRRRWTRI